MKVLQMTTHRIVGAILALAGFGAVWTFGQEIKTAAELGLSGMSPDTKVLVLQSDPHASPVEPMRDAGAGNAVLGSRGMGQEHTTRSVFDGVRTGCPDLGFTRRAYARDSGNDWPWIPANTLVADDLTLVAGSWIMDCYDVLIYADNTAAYGCNHSRTVTLRAYNACNGAMIAGSQETWTVPAYGGPILLTGATNVNFAASGTIWFGLTTTSDECDGWYLGQSQINGSTANVFQLATDCNACINPPTCSPWAGFIVVLYGCTLPVINTHPANAVICSGGWNQFCVNASGTGTLRYQWQLGGNNISGATSACYVATQAASYRCVVTDDCGTTMSNSATLTVRTGPAITAQPQGGTSCAARPLQLCVSANAIGTLHYQWKRGGLTIIGATAACYVATQPGSYTCVLTDDCGTTTSDAATVLLATPTTGDFNGDALANSTDWNLLTGCWSAPAGGIATGCECVDTDSDADIDLADFLVLQCNFAG